jgi:hypothetical protein
MINKEKKCKGIGKAKESAGCGKITMFRKYGLCQSCYVSFLTTTVTGKSILSKAITTAKKPRKDYNDMVRTTKENKSLESLKKTVVNLCHKYIRLRDVGKPCISCNAPHKDNFQAGHFYSAGSYSNIKYNEYNINGQCEQCNLREYGNVNGYNIYLPKRIGIDKIEDLHELARQYKKESFKWDRQELLKLGNYYKKLIKEL